jgi:uncharacterized protein (TIGR00369 family)
MAGKNIPENPETVLAEVVFPNDTNPMGIVHGGRVIQLMDIASAICAQMHSGKIAVTAGIDKVSFIQPAKLGDILTIRAHITRTFNTSMEIHVEVWAMRLPALKPFLSNTAYFTFVALDENARPTAVRQLTPLTPEAKKQHREALKRRKTRKA